MANGQSVEHAMQYLQEVEKELPEREFAEFLNVIEEFKSNRCLAGTFSRFAACRQLPRTRGRALPPHPRALLPLSATQRAHVCAHPAQSPSLLSWSSLWSPR
jgi:hypothetical protein